MDVVATIAEVRDHLDAARRDGRTVGLVPTMGYLHAGHRSLVARAVAEHDAVAVTLFVNPLQFGAGEDLEAYPRDFDADAAMVAAEGADVLFAPSVAEMYPEPVTTSITVGEVATRFEGASRPTHFAGVATVVAKLFAIAGPCTAYFGEKDWQQLAVIRRMVRDLSIPVVVQGCPTVREPDGLALSSRNVYLSAEQRAAAPTLHGALRRGVEAIEGGERDPDVVRAAMEAVVRAEPLAELDYVDVVDAAGLARVDPLRGELRLLGAARFGPARLIDNIGATVA